MRRSKKQKFSVIVERDEEGYYVASVPELPGCYTQARSLDKLIEQGGVESPDPSAGGLPYPHLPSSTSSNVGCGSYRYVRSLGIPETSRDNNNSIKIDGN